MVASTFRGSLVLLASLSSEWDQQHVSRVQCYIAEDCLFNDLASESQVHRLAIWLDQINGKTDGSPR
jgi:hypothetical protein